MDNLELFLCWGKSPLIHPTPLTSGEWKMLVEASIAAWVLDEKSWRADLNPIPQGLFAASL